MLAKTYHDQPPLPNSAAKAKQYDSPQENSQFVWFVKFSARETQLHYPLGEETTRFATVRTHRSAPLAWAWRSSHINPLSRLV
jgi:hypothetical protein